MASRDKDQADFDLETFVDLFDTTISSDNPAVKKALRNLIMIAAIVNAENKDPRDGPLRRVIEDQKNILRRLDRIENERIYPQSPVVPTPYTPNMPLGPYVPPTYAPNTNPLWPNTITCGTTSTTAHEDQFKSYGVLLEKLENK